MTVRRFTSFDLGVNSTLLAADGWYGDLTSSISAGAGRFGRGNSLLVNWDNIFGHDRYYALGGTIGTTIFATFGMMAQLGYGGDMQMSLVDTRTGTFAAKFVLTSLGAFQVYNASGTLVTQTPIGTFALSSWFQFEAKVYQHATAGTIDVRYNTKPIISVPSTNTMASGSFSPVGVDAFRLFRPANGSSAPVLFNELIFSDDQGSVNNSWLGTVNVNSQMVVGNGHLNQFTIGGSSPAATNWQSVLNTALNDTKYVYDPTVGDVDFYAIDPSLNSPAVYALQVKAAMRQDDATQRIGRVGVRVGSTDYIGSVDFYLDQNYRLYSDMWELSPASGTGMSGSDVNAMQIGVKVNA